MNLNPTKLVLGLLTPFIAAASAWLAAAAAKYGVHLDPAGINALGVAGATAGAAAMVKLIHDVESKPSVAQLVGEAQKIAVQNPDVKALVQGAVEQAQKVLQAQFNELVAAIPQPPAAPAPVVAPAPAPAPPPVA